ncbi:thimet oligopeptidase-like isoform 1-T1 [Megaptera novaeangliae]
MNQGEETRYHEDQYLLNESFPMQVVTRGRLGISQELLGLTFDLEEGANVCHEDVRLYTVRDTASGKVIHRQVLPGPLPLVRACVQEPVGCGPELLCGSWASPRVPPQKVKTGHAACFGLQPGCLQQDGSRQIAMVAMVANFTKPMPDPPSLLQHDELETYFHEFWQAMHQLRSQASSTCARSSWPRWTRHCTRRRPRTRPRRMPASARRSSGAQPCQAAKREPGPP